MRKIWFLAVSILVIPNFLQGKIIAASPTINSEQACPQQPALSRLQRHTITSGENLNSIAQKYNLIPETLMGMNPVLQTGKAPVGAEIVIPPYNGIRVSVPSGQTWRDVATAYRIKPDVLYEVNGCQSNPRIVFVPGVNWTPGSPNVQALAKLSGYPLPQTTAILTQYGWRLNPLTSQVNFNSGVDLKAEVGTPVLAVGDGTVAFAGDRDSQGKLVVINHSGGRQTRYAHLAQVNVTVGQKIQQGAQIGTVGTTGTPNHSEPHLHFEVRYNSPLGWVAEDPSLYIDEINNAQQF